MISPDLVVFVHGPQVMLVGTRSKALRPTVRRVFGAIVDSPSDTITFFLPACESELTMENLADNGRVALLIIDAFSHCTYQFKGAFLAARPCTDKDKAVRDVYIDKTVVHFRNWFLPVPDPFWRNFILEPSHAVSFQVEAIFDQAPGPNAGKPLAFTPGP